MDFKADDISKTSCTLNWQPPENDGGSPITGYTVERLSGTRWVKVNKKPIKECTLSLTDLIEGSDNEFRVCAENEAGVGEPSDTTGRFKAKDAFDVPGRPDAKRRPGVLLLFG